MRSNSVPRFTKTVVRRNPNDDDGKSLFASVMTHGNVSVLILKSGGDFSAEKQVDTLIASGVAHGCQCSGHFRTAELLSTWLLQVCRAGQFNAEQMKKLAGTFGNQSSGA